MMKRLNKLGCLSLAKPFQLSLLFGGVGLELTQVQNAPFHQYIWAGTNFRKSMSKLLNFFILLLTKGLFKLECLTLASLFSLVYYLGLRLELTQVKNATFLNYIWAWTNFRKSKSGINFLLCY
jgi:hypothetical protein